MLGVGLRKLCPQDSFGYAFREKKLSENRPPEGAKPAREGSKMAFGSRAALLCQLGPTRQGRSEAVFGRLWGRSWGAPGSSWGCLETS